MNANKNTWSVDRIESDEWGSVNCQAVVWASNWAHDEMDFCIIWHPDDYPVHYDVTRRFVSKELQPFDADKIILNELLDSAVEQLDDWWSEVEALKKDLSVDKWKVPKGLAAPEILYAKCAVLYSLRSEFCPLRVVKLMAKDMSVPETTVKERLRKAKDKGFLTNPGKGLNGQGEVTQAAIKLIKKEGK